MSLGRRAAHAMSVVLLFQASAGAQNLNGPELQVNTFTSGDQKPARVAADGGGRFIVVWAGNGPDDSSGVFARRYLSSGTPVGVEFRVNASVSPGQVWPAVAAAADAGFVVAWHASGDGYGDGVFARRFDAHGAPIGDDFQVNTMTTGDQRYVDVGMGSDGSFVVVWNDIQYGTYYTIRARQYDSGGAPVGEDFQVNSSGTAYQYHPRIAALGGGGFVAVWDGDGLLDDAEIFARRYDTAGSPIGPQFRVNSNIVPWDAYPSVAADATGAFVVSWQADTDGNFNYDIFARRFDAAGDPAATQFRVNTYTTGYQYVPSVASDRLGNFIVTWDQVGVDGSGDGVQARRYASNGNALGTDFRVNTYTINHQYYSSVAVDPRENFFVVWRSIEQDGSGSGIFGQRLGDFIFGDGFR